MGCISAKQRQGKHLAAIVPAEILPGGSLAAGGEKGIADAPDLTEGDPLDHSPQKNSAFVFIKPHAVKEGVKKMVKEKLAERKISIVAEGVIDGKVIDEKGLIDTHYGAIASRAVKQKPKELVVQEKAKAEFFQVFGLTWDSALEQGLVYNAADGAVKLSVTPLELGQRFQKTKRGSSQVKFGGGFYVANLDSIYVVNGFYAELRSKFTAPDSQIVFFQVEWDPQHLDWLRFRRDIIGATNPAEAAEGSLRAAIRKKWKELGLPAEPDTSDNGVHASASPFEGMAERVNWLSSKVSEDPFAKALLSAGLKEATIQEWMGDPAVTFEGKQQSLFDLLEDLDAAQCVQKCQLIAS